MATDPSNNNDPTDAIPEGVREDPDEAAEAPRSQTSAKAEKEADKAAGKSAEKSEKPAASTAEKDPERPSSAPMETTLSKSGGTDSGGADVVSSHDDDDELDDDELGAGGDSTHVLRGAVPGGSFAAGAAAVVSAGLGLCSLTGTSLGEMLRSRKELIGQIESSTGGGGGGGEEQIDAFYSTPWHTAAVLNGIFALAAVIIGGVLLGLLVQRAETKSWVKAVALGGLILGALGLLVSLGMYFDLFASTPELPDTPQQPQAPPQG